MFVYFEEEVVGTPYWMAPEIIELRNLTPACDVWSLGATTIELITGKPPYFDLDPLPAMFRIVQDPNPPLPRGISTVTQFSTQRLRKKEKSVFFDLPETGTNGFVPYFTFHFQKKTFPTLSGVMYCADSKCAGKS